MTTLLYRGHQYQQNNATQGKPGVQLVYRRNVYQARQINNHRTPVQLRVPRRGLHPLGQLLNP